MNRSVVDQFTIAHLGGGMATRAITGNRLLGWAIIIGYEIIEKPLLKTQYETPVNQIGDIVTSIAGWEYLNHRYIEGGYVESENEDPVRDPSDGQLSL